MHDEPPELGVNGTRDCGTFFLDVMDQFARDEVLVTWSDLPRATNDSVEKLIDASWCDQTQRAEGVRTQIFNGQLCRLISHRCENAHLNLTLGPVSFKEFIGTNATQAYIRHLHGPEVMADPLGVSAAVCTNDGLIVLGMRNKDMIQYAGRIHPVGGTVEPPEDHTAASPDPFQAILDELHEETAVPPEKVSNILCLGLVRDRNTVQPELIFDVHVDCDVVSLFASAATAVDAAEHSSMVPVRDHPGAVVSFMEQHFSQLTPVAMATLLLHGLRHWGSGWFATARGYLRSVI
jgi:8-oxo-dGTP pyrophosphatase MutT (NUDIX family)